MPNTATLSRRLTDDAESRPTTLANLSLSLSYNVWILVVCCGCCVQFAWSFTP